jgi:ubiquinone/menaquinone biosynthesis C-methylase UbiE
VENSATNARPDYGLDAPGIVKTLLLAAGAALLVLIARLLGLWNERSGLALLFFPLLGIGFGAGMAALSMIWYSRVGKIQAREKLFDNLHLRGDEIVLDIGCGRGLWLLAAAKRLPRGHAVGIDIWNAKDLSDNAAARTLNNAQLEGVADRIELLTADARRLPFDNDHFDLIVSSAAIHNIYDAPGRATAIREIARVLKPGGRVVIFDIRHADEYATTLQECGCEARMDRSWKSKLVTVWTFRSLAPGIAAGAKPLAAALT